MEGTWLSAIVFLPLLGAAVVALLPDRLTRTAATVFAAAELALTAPLWWRMDLRNGAWQFAERRDWIPSWGASYSLSVDGISVLLVLLTSVLTLIAIVGAFSSVEKRGREFFALLLALETGMLGTFLATDLLLFYVFWEAMLIPMYLLIGVWGGQRRVYAAIKFFLYTMVGSVLMLIAILWLYFHHKAVAGFPTFALDAYYGLPLPADMQTWLFLAFALAFAIKVPMFPFHTWLPDAHVEAPTAGSVILAAVLLKMGTYGFIRFAIPIFPVASATFTPWIVGLALVGILYGALVAMVQPDLKKLVAYSSVSHLGFCMLGMYAMNTQGMTGAMLQMLNHGVSTGALFLLVGVIYERRHTRLIADFGGLWKPIPIFAATFLVVMLSSIGLPGTNGFIGEFLVLLGAFRVNPWWSAIASVGVVLSACYMLWMFQRVVFGPVTHPENAQLRDLTLREQLVFAPILFLIFWMGVTPQPFIDRMSASIERTLEIAEVRTRTSLALEATRPSGGRVTLVAPAPAATAGGAATGQEAAR